MKLLPILAAASLFTAVTTVVPAGSAAAAQATPPPPAEAPAPPPPGAPPPGDPLGPDLYAAIRTGNVPAVKSLIAQGAQLEGRNWLGITPLIWASAVGNEASCSELIKAGAKVDAPSRYGTALSFAAMAGHSTIVRLLLDSGATANPERTDDISPLMTAAESGSLPVVHGLLAHKAAVNARDYNGLTPLMFAARRGQTEAARLLLDAGAKVNAKDSQGRTALMHAAMNGHAGCTSLLIARHAAVSTRNSGKETALHLAARYSGSVEVARALIRAGADRAAIDAKGRTACRIAVAHENRAFAVATLPVRTPLPRTTAKQTDLPVQARQAALRSLPLIESSARNFAEKAACVSCHHEGLGLMTTALAGKRGFFL